MKNVAVFIFLICMFSLGIMMTIHMFHEFEHLSYFFNGIEHHEYMFKSFELHRLKKYIKFFSLFK